MKKVSDLEWYVLHWDFNKKKIVNLNILGDYFKKSLEIELKAGHIYDKSILKEYLKTYFMYHYWSKTEYEFLVSDVHEDEYEKIDIWRQIEPNLNNIVEYINIKMDLKF